MDTVQIIILFIDWLTVQCLALIRLSASQKTIEGTVGGELVKSLHYRPKQSMDDKASRNSPV